VARVSPEVAKPVVDPRIPGDAALEAAIDYVGDEPDPSHSVHREVGLGRGLLPDNDGVAGGLGLPLRHPEPQRRLERHQRVVGHFLLVPQPVEAQRLPGGSVFVVPATTQIVTQMQHSSRQCSPFQ